MVNWILLLQWLRPASVGAQEAFRLRHTGSAHLFNSGRSWISGTIRFLPAGGIERSFESGSDGFSSIRAILKGTFGNSPWLSALFHRLLSALCAEASTFSIASTLHERFFVSRGDPIRVIQLVRGRDEEWAAAPSIIGCQVGRRIVTFDAVLST